MHYVGAAADASGRVGAERCAFAGYMVHISVGQAVSEQAQQTILVASNFAICK
jgi:hypothetical protein